MCIKAPTHRPDSNQQPTAFVQSLCCLSSDPFGRRVALNTTSTAANHTVVCTFWTCARLGSASLMPVIQNMRTGNDRTQCIEKHSAHRRVQRAHRIPPLPPHWFTSTLPITMVIQLAHNQSEYPMAQTANSQCFQTKSEQTLSTQSQKLPMQLNRPNRFVPKLVRVSPNTSDGQRLARCVSGFRNEIGNFTTATRALVCWCTKAKRKYVLCEHWIGLRTSEVHWWKQLWAKLCHPAAHVDMDGWYLSNWAFYICVKKNQLLHPWGSQNTKH